MSHEIASQSATHANNTLNDVYRQSYSTIYLVRPPFVAGEGFSRGVLGVFYDKASEGGSSVDILYSSSEVTAVQATGFAANRDVATRRANILGERMLELLNAADAETYVNLCNTNPNLPK